MGVNHRETYGGTYLNMADHRFVGEATIGRGLAVSFELLSI